MYLQTYGYTAGHTPHTYTCPINQNAPRLHLTHVCEKFFLLKANFLTPKGTGKSSRESPDCTGNEPTPYILIGLWVWHKK